MPEAALAAIFATSFVVGLSGSLMPGPLLALNISEAARRGFWAGPILILGHAIIEFATVVALAWGLGKLLGNDLVAGVIGLLGGMFLVWMGIGLVRGAGYQAVLVANNPGATGSMSRLVLSGILVSISNPFWVLWWATVGTTYVIWSLQQGMAGISSFYLGHILSDLSWYSLVGVLVSRGLTPKLYRGLMTACGAFLLALAGYFIYSGAAFFLA